MPDLLKAEEAPQPWPQVRTSVLRPKCLCVDLETSIDASPVIHKVAAWRPDTDEKIVFSGRFSQAELRSALERLAAGASFVLGHNIVAHDLPILYAHFGDAVLGGVPAFDTLELSPIAFPQNPYHRLVKDYKLVRDSRIGVRRRVAARCGRQFGAAAMGRPPLPTNAPTDRRASRYRVRTTRMRVLQRASRSALGAWRRPPANRARSSIRCST